ncbi:MAG: EamA family transporter [Candidatus Thorarchaeota archaeon]|nr:MAG: EamA family transporter [Candidatus Thorarchaeota archaeon]
MDLEGVPKGDIEVTEKKEKTDALGWLRAVGLALLVTVLWSSSWVIIKFGLEELPPVTFSGLRYTIAAVILLGVIASRVDLRVSVRSQRRDWWAQITIYGIVFVAVTQGAQFVGLALLEAITVSMLLNLTPMVVLVLGVFLLRERPASTQIAWIVLSVIGVFLYFHPVSLAGAEMLGLLVVVCGVIANAFSSIIGRAINREKRAPSVVVTGMSMAIGSALLLLAGLLLEGPVAISPLSWFYILWLSVVNTAFAFTLWNKAMQTLRAIDTTLINSTMLPQIVVLSILFLGEMPDVLDWIGLILIGLSVAAVQISQARKASEEDG